MALVLLTLALRLPQGVVLRRKQEKKNRLREQNFEERKKKVKSTQQAEVHSPVPSLIIALLPVLYNNNNQNRKVTEQSHSVFIMP